MASLWEGYTSYRSVKVVTPGNVLEVWMVTAFTIPTGIMFTYGIPIAGSGAFDPTSPGAALLTTIAQQIEEMVAGNHVVGGSPSQDVNNKTGLIDDFQDLIVELDRGATGLPPLQGTAHFLMQDFFNQDTGIGGLNVGQLPTQVVDQVYQDLQVLAAGV
jgi:hypothetical protein